MLSVTSRMQLSSRETIHLSAGESRISERGGTFVPSQFMSTNRDAFQTLFRKLRPASTFVLL